MNDLKFPVVLGVAGVAPDENYRAKQFARWMEWPMLMVAIWIVVEWYLQAKGLVDRDTVRGTDWLVWGFFAFETAVMTILVDRKVTYLKHNWISLIIIVFGFPVLWEKFPAAGVLRALRLLVLVNLLTQVSGTARRILSKNNLGPTLFVGFILMLFAGFLIAGIDPGIDTPWEGIWWAWVTVTTVGYGDVVPTSTAGRLFASFLILMGIGLFSLLTANFSAFFVSREEKNLVKRQLQMMTKLEDMEDRLQHIDKAISYLVERDIERNPDEIDDQMAPPEPKTPSGSSGSSTDNPDDGESRQKPDPVG